MPPYRNIYLVAGTITLICLMLKIFKSKPDKIQSSEKDADSKKKVEVEEKNSESSVNSAEVKPRLNNKRKIEELEGTMKILKTKPNFFIAVQVYNNEIHKKVKQLQEKIISQNPLLHSALVNVSTLHVTLAVTHLASETDIKVVKDKMNDWAEKNVNKFFAQPLSLTFIGTNTFSGTVGFVDIKRCTNYNRLVDLSENMNTLLSSAGFNVDKKCLQPHLTFLKLSKDFKLIRLKKNFKEIFSSFEGSNENFGEQVVTEIQLLKMEKAQNGYYKCFHQISVPNHDKLEMDHSECCTPILIPKKTK